eukprot:g805.t1
MTNEIYTKEFGSSGQTKSFLQTMDIEHRSNGNFLSDAEKRSTTVKESVAKIEAPVKVERSQHGGNQTDHWRKRRWIPPQESTEHEIENTRQVSQKVAKLATKSKTSFEDGGSAFSVSAHKPHVFSTKSRLCRFGATGIGQRIWPVAFKKCTGSNSATENLCEFSRKIPMEQNRPGASKLSNVVDEMMHRTRLHALKTLREHHERVLFLKSADGLTRVVFSNENEDNDDMELKASSNVFLSQSETNKKTHDVRLMSVGNPILDSKVIQQQSKQMMSQNCSMGTVETVLLPVESRVIGKNGCQFDFSSMQVSKDEGCLFHGLPERPVLVPPSTAVLSGLAQPPPLARFRTNNNSSNSNNSSSSNVLDPVPQGNNNNSSSSSLTMKENGDLQDDIVNRAEACYRHHHQHHPILQNPPPPPPVIVSIPYIDTGGCPVYNLHMGAHGPFSSLKTFVSYSSSNIGGVQSCMSGSFFVNSISQSLKEAVKPNLPFVQDFQDAGLPPIMKTNSSPESTLASILEFIKNGEGALQNTLKKEDNSEVFKDVIAGKVINKVIVE